MEDDIISNRPLVGEARLSHLDPGAPPERARPHIAFSYPPSHDRRAKFMSNRSRRPRDSVFKELWDVETMPVDYGSQALAESTGVLTGRPIQRIYADSFDSLQSDDSVAEYEEGSVSSDDLTALPGPQNGWTDSWRAFRSSRLMMLALILAVAMPLLFETPLLGNVGLGITGVTAGVIRRSGPKEKEFVDGKLLLPRQNTDTNVCQRWSQQSALVNGTIYLYGGQATTDPTQTSNTWNNDFLTIDVTKTWGISAPSIVGLPQPSGPPPVANGYLWNSYDSLFLYGGEYSSNPTTTPSPYSLWEYNIPNASWIEHQNPTSSKGNNSDGGNQPILGSAEGAGITVSQLGRGFYFAGHEDPYTTAGWAQPVPRLYLKSLLEFTFPGYSNNGVQSLSGGQVAGSDGVWRNITQGGIQDTAEFPSRADSVLVYVPGYGEQGILVSMGGGTNESFTQMNVIDVYDIASSTWYKQSTSGSYPILRVNPCAVAASAADGSSTNIYMFGGQNLIPAGNQTQYSDMWILTVPSFTWIEVDQSGQSVPAGRTGHTCNIWDGQMVVVGGYTGPPQNGLGCDSGFYVFSLSNLTWQNNFNALSGSDTQNQQAAQAKDPQGLSGSYGYAVPAAVQSVIGGKATGGATVTAPAQAATAGPLATGKPITYTVTGANGAVTTETGTVTVGGGGGGGGGGGSSSGGKGGPNIAAIVAGVVAGLLAILAAYLGFCAWVYRRQLQLYKRHVAMSQRAAAAGGPGEKAAFLSQGSSGAPKYSTDQSSRNAASGTGSTPGTSGYEPVPPMPGGAPIGGNSTANSSTEDLAGEPSFVGVLLNPRRSLRVINRD